MRCLRSICSALALLGCSGAGSSGDAPAPRPDLSGPLPYAELSRYGFFTGELAELSPAPGVEHYEVVAPLWSDGTHKDRFLVLPEGASWTPGDELPVGTAVIKNFAHGGRHLETRLLLREAAKWTGHVYLWNDEQTEATRIIAGKRLILTDEGGATRLYLVPNTNQCGGCHERDDVMGVLGLTPAQLEPEGSPLVDPYGDAPLERRARSWLHANCAHCHREGGNGGPSGLELGIDETNSTHLGICKGPVAAGGGSGELLVDIDPGHPERSILVHRLKSSDPETKMPEIPNLLPDPRGVPLIESWIREMPERCP